MRRENHCNLILIFAVIMMLFASICYAQSAQEYMRLRIDLAIPKKTWDGLTQIQRDAIKAKLMELKAMATKINIGKTSEENTVSIKYHLCRHELGLPCLEEKDF